MTPDSDADRLGDPDPGRLADAELADPDTARLRAAARLGGPDWLADPDMARPADPDPARPPGPALAPPSEPAAAGSPTLLVMAKAPRPGTVKTRLHRLLGPSGCADLQTELIRHTIGLACAVGVRVVVAFAPADAESEVRALVPDAVRLVAQEGTHLGERLAAAAGQAQPAGGPLVVIGADAPTLTAGLVRQAFAALERGGGAVLGPALDGGYYLLGVRWPQPDAFAIDPALWGGEHVRAATLARLRGLGRIELLPALRDLDTLEDAAALLADPALASSVRAVLDAAGARA